MSHATDHPSPSPHCLNCHYTLSTPRPAYCGHCGQETDLHPPSVGEFIHEYVGHYVALEGPLWRSLWALVFLPGQLTREYFTGRRRRYVLPLRLYLTASFLFFVLGHLLPQQGLYGAKLGQAYQQGQQNKQARPAAPVAALPASASVSGTAADNGFVLASVDDELTACLPAGGHCGWLKTQIARGLDKLQRLKGADVQAGMGRAAPYAMLLMQPVFALILLLMFAGSGRRYAEHFVFSLHMHALWFLAMLLEQLSGLAEPLFGALMLHGLLALRTVYGRGWWANIWRSLLASLLYMVALALGSAGLVIVVVLLS